MAIEWYVSTRDGERGPFSGAELKQWAAEGWLKPEMFIKRGAEGKWVPARRVKGLVFTEKPGSGPVQTPPPPASQGPVEQGVGPSGEAAAEPPGAPSAANGFPQIRIETTEPDTAAARHRPSGPRRSLIRNRTFRQGVLVAGGVLAAALVVVGVFLFVRSRPPAGARVGEGSASQPPKESRSIEEPIPVTSETEPDASQAILELDWPEEEREGAAVYIDLKKAELPASGEVRYALEPGEHRVELRRRGYMPHDFTGQFTAGETHVHPVELMKAGAFEPVPKQFDQWIDRFAESQSDADEAERVVSQLNEDPWVESFAAEDPGLAARLHLQAAVLLFRTGLHERVPEQCQAGLACKPADPECELWDVETEFWLVLFQELCRQVRPHGERIVGTGTGFCVAQGGYLLTNHHVIDVAEKIKVQLAGHGDLVAAELTAADPSADVALLKVGLPVEVDLAPIPIATSAAQLGQEVCLLGYPFTGTNENTLKVVRGIVSSLPAGPGGGIEIDSPVNPGNSGGPLLSYQGDVLGMVTEKIFSFDPTVTPLGRAIPAERLRRFLDAALRKEGKQVVTGKATGTLSAQELTGRLGPSVVLILSIR